MYRWLHIHYYTSVKLLVNNNLQKCIYIKIMSSNPTVLSYKDSLLRESDVSLLQGPFWLNDTIISFYFEYLEHECFKDHPELLFVPPEVTQCIKLMPADEIRVFLDPIVHGKKFIFFGLNDSESAVAAGGSHWSLLVFSKPERAVFHYDSSGGINDTQANDLSEKILRYFSLPYQGKFKDVDCLQQGNGYDCGVHLICNAEQLASYASHYNRIEGCPKIEHTTVSLKRQEVLIIIGRLKKRINL